MECRRAGKCQNRGVPRAEGLGEASARQRARPRRDRGSRGQRSGCAVGVRVGRSGRRLHTAARVTVDERGSPPSGTRVPEGEEGERHSVSATRPPSAATLAPMFRTSPTSRPSAPGGGSSARAATFESVVAKRRERDAWRPSLPSFSSGSPTTKLEMTWRVRSGVSTPLRVTVLLERQQDDEPRCRLAAREQHDALRDLFVLVVRGGGGRVRERAARRRRRRPCATAEAVVRGDGVCAVSGCVGARERARRRFRDDSRRRAAARRGTRHGSGAPKRPVECSTPAASHLDVGRVVDLAARDGVEADAAVVRPVVVVRALRLAVARSRGQSRVVARRAVARRAVARSPVTLSGRERDCSLDATPHILLSRAQRPRGRAARWSARDG